MEFTYIPVILPANGPTPALEVKQEVPSKFGLLMEPVPVAGQCKFTIFFNYAHQTWHMTYHFFADADVEHLDVIKGIFAKQASAAVKDVFPGMHENVYDITVKRIYNVLGVPMPVTVSQADLIFTDGYNIGGPTVGELSMKLPGVDSVVRYPCSCDDRPKKDSLWAVIVHLNDGHEDWSRERIADWVDELHDAGIINAEFQPWGELES